MRIFLTGVLMFLALNDLFSQATDTVTSAVEFGEFVDAVDTDEVLGGFSGNLLVTASNERSREDDYTFLDGLRRFEIIFFGTLPITLLFVDLAYNVGRYVYYGIDAGFDSNIAVAHTPRLFASSSYDNDERGWLLFSAIISSLVIATIDIIIEITKHSQTSQ